MFCEQCGHALNENKICPVCGWRSPADVSGSQPNIQYNQQPNAQPNMQYGQPNTQPNMQYRQPNRQSGGQPNAQPNMQYGQPNAQPNMQYRQPYGQPGGQPNAQPNMQYRQPYGQPNMQYRQPGSTPPQKKKKKWPIFVGVGAGVICLTIGLVLIFKKPTRDYTTTESERTTEYSASTEPTTETPTTQHANVASGSKTLMIYVVGSDLESKHHAVPISIRCLDELSPGSLDPSTDRTAQWQVRC